MNDKDNIKQLQQDVADLRVAVYRLLFYARRIKYKGSSGMGLLAQDIGEVECTLARTDPKGNKFTGLKELPKV